MASECLAWTLPRLLLHGALLSEAPEKPCGLVGVRPVPEGPCQDPRSMWMVFAAWLGPVFFSAGVLMCSVSCWLLLWVTSGSQEQDVVCASALSCLRAG